MEKELKDVSELFELTSKEINNLFNEFSDVSSHSNASLIEEERLWIIKE